MSKCSQCGQEGHNARTCGRVPEDKPAKAGTKRCGSCGEYGHNARTCGTQGNVAMYALHIESTYPGLVSMLGSVSDAIVGDRYGMTRQRVHQIRTRLNIPSSKDNNP